MEQFASVDYKILSMTNIAIVPIENIFYLQIMNENITCYIEYTWDYLLI